MRRLIPVLAVLAAGAGLAAWSFGGSAATAKPNRFDEDAAWAFLKRQVALGPRPAGSRKSRQLAEILRRSTPGGRFQAVPGGLRNVIGTIPGRNPRRRVVLGAHYDSKDIPRFVGANDSASGTAVVRQLARTIKARQLRPTLIIVFFDGEEAPKGRPDSQFEQYGLRGSKVAAAALRNLESAIVLDFVGDKNLAIPRDQYSDRDLWTRLRAAARRTGNTRHFPTREQGPVLDDHVPFVRRGVPAIDLIDFDFPCWHKRCDDLSAVSKASLDAVGETMMAFLAGL